MDVLESHIRTTSPEFGTNRDRMATLVAEYRERLALVKQGGGPK
jgi:hypothetical protein